MPYNAGRPPHHPSPLLFVAAEVYGVLPRCQFLCADFFMLAPDLQVGPGAALGPNGEANGRGQALISAAGKD